MEKTPERTIAALCERLMRRARKGDSASALHATVGFVRAILAQQSSFSRVFSSRELDQTCLAIGHELRSIDSMADPGERTDCIVFIVTHLAKIGGHSRLLADLIAAETAEKCSILVTDLLDRFEPEEVASLYQSSSVTMEVAPRSDFSARTRWLQMRLAKIRPRKTYLLNHHFDAVCIAAVQPDLVGDLVYVHHCDYGLALGVHIPYARHVDFSAKGFYNCRDREGVQGNVAWPLVVSDFGPRGMRPFLTRGYLTTSSCGSAEKFQFGTGQNAVPYAYQYGELVPYILKCSGGMHIHIGRLSPGVLASIRSGLGALGIDLARFVHVEQVENLWQALLALGVDVYIGSFPMGGGRATIEAMGAGLPLVTHVNYRSSFFSSSTDVYPDAMIWETPQELFSALAGLTVEELERHSRRAREFYLLNHRAELLAEAIAATARGRISNPERPIYVGSALQAFLDENEAAFSGWFQRKRKGVRRSLASLGRRIASFAALRQPAVATAIRYDWIEAIERLKCRDAQDGGETPAG